VIHLISNDYKASKIQRELSKMKSYQIFVFLVSFSFAITQDLRNSEISDACIGCICYGSTKCQKDAGCSDAGVCGPLLISWAYWADAGKHVLVGTSPSDPNAYPQCVHDTYCAAETVRGYMAKYGRDCNGDGRIDCDDFARIHKRGPGSCSDPNVQDTKYYKDFSTCSAQLRP